MDFIAKIRFKQGQWEAGTLLGKNRFFLTLKLYIYRIRKRLFLINASIWINYNNFDNCFWSNTDRAKKRRNFTFPFSSMKIKTKKRLLTIYIYYIFACNVFFCFCLIYNYVHFGGKYGIWLQVSLKQV